jgi:radical SAM superfamily enzyme YgiQ (UPF0313 family)
MNSNVLPNLDGSMTYQDLPLDYLFPQGNNFEKQFIEYIKTINSKIKIISGGTTARADCQNKNIDFVVLGYGESSILSIDSHVSHGDPIPYAMKNIWGVTVIDNRTSAGYDFQHSTFAWENTDVVNCKVLPIEISRGCIFKCSFCSYPMNGKKNLDFVRLSNLLEQELQKNYNNFGIENFWILDDTFNDNEYKLNIILDAVKRLSYQPKFWAYLRLDLLATKNHIDKLYDIGVRYMYFGIESLNPKTGRAVGKGYDRNKQINMLKYIKQRYPDIRVHGSFIIGLPHETIDSCRDTVSLCLSKEIPLDSFQIKGLRIRRQSMIPWSSEIDKAPEKFGYTILPTPENVVLLNWKNQYTNNQEAYELGEEWTELAHKSAGFKLPGQDIFSLKNYGYSDELMHNIDYKDVDWHSISLAKELYVSQYKKQLKELLLFPHCQ